jgi:hypothetical protein
MAPSEITLGCDPELVCRLNGRFTSASEYFRSRSSTRSNGKSSKAEIYLKGGVLCIVQE